MKKLLVCLAVAMTATAARAQEAAAAAPAPAADPAPAHGQKPVLGIGASVSSDRTIIAVPVNVTPALRVEPFVGYVFDKETEEIPGADQITTTSKFDVGVGAYLLKEVAENVELLAGAKVALGFGKFKHEDQSTSTTASSSATTFGIAAVGGGEYYLSPHFALGVEAELGLVTGDSGVDLKQTTFETASFVTAKVFF